MGYENGEFNEAECVAGLLADEIKGVEKVKQILPYVKNPDLKSTLEQKNQQERVHAKQLYSLLAAYM